MSADSRDLVSAPSEFLLYAAPGGAVKVRVLFKDETAWLTQKALAELFGVKVPAVAKHLKNIFDSGELQEDSVVWKQLPPTARTTRPASTTSTRSSPSATA